MKNLAMIINGFAAGWLMIKSGFTADSIIAWIAIGITTVYLSNTKNK